jgi:selenocysteine lyase/cysteine desulfurase
VPIDMHPADPAGKLDAVFFSPHKFLGGPGSCGVLIFDKSLYHNRVPDDPGGGTVSWTNPWGGHSYIEDIELREDGGTPGFIQTIRAAMAVRLKEHMGIDALLAREEELLQMAFDRLEKIEGVHMLAANVRDRLAILSFYLDDLHYNLAVKVLNDEYGIQVRGGCSCAGTYGHFLLHVDKAMSDRITERIDQGDLSMKPGWVRLSLHPIMTNVELTYILDAIEEVVRNKETWKEAYRYCSDSNEFVFKADDCSDGPDVSDWFDLPGTDPAEV